MSGVLVSPAQWLAIATFLVLAILASTQVGSIWHGEQQREWPEWLARSLPACMMGGPSIPARRPQEALARLGWASVRSAYAAARLGQRCSYVNQGSLLRLV
jgi:hypothetical protein